MSQSTNNQTYVPLSAGAIFLGTWDNVLNYDCAFYNIEASTACQISVYQSNNKIDYSVSTYNYTSGYVTNEIFLEQRYIYVTVRNSSGSDQTSMMFNMIYKSSGLVAGTVSVSNFPATYPTVSSIVSSVLWNNVAVLASGVSTAITNTNAKDFFIYGTTSGSTTFTLQTSRNGITYYTASQYSITVNGNFGYTISNVPAPYLRIVSSNAVTITLIASYC